MTVPGDMESPRALRSFDLIVIGGGIVGCAVAREAARSQLRVALIEDGVVGGAATAAAMGHIVVMDDSPAQLALTHYSRSLWQEELRRLPPEAEYEARGTIWIAADEEEMAEVCRKQRMFAAMGIRSSTLSAAALALEEPNLRPSLAGGLLVPDDGVLYPPVAASFFLAEAQSLGATHIRSAARSAGAGEVELADGSRVRAAYIVLATGTQLHLLQSLPLQKRKGHLVITDRHPGFAHHQLLELGYLKSAGKSTGDSVAFNIQPRRTGQILIGSSRQYGVDDPAVEPAMLERMLTRAKEYMPGIARLSAVRIWTGFRAATADKLPLIGPATGLSEDRSLWLAVGFEGLGITDAPAAAVLLIDGLLGRRSTIDRAPYLPARMATEAVQHA